MARVTVIGRCGRGKSYYTGYLLEQIVLEFTLAIHHHIEDEERGLSDANHDPLYRALTVNPQDARKLNWERVIAKNRKIRVVPSGLTTDEQRALYAGICKRVMRLCKDVQPKATRTTCSGRATFRRRASG
jgi:hypothetical protein